MTNDNLKAVLSDLIYKYETEMIGQARVRTGRLRDSIRTEITYEEDKSNIKVIMMEYGVYPKVWKDLKNPPTRFESFFNDDVLSILGKTVAKDVLAELKQELDLIKKTKV